MQCGLAVGCPDHGGKLLYRRVVDIIAHILKDAIFRQSGKPGFCWHFGPVRPLRATHGADDGDISADKGTESRKTGRIDGVFLGTALGIERGQAGLPENIFGIK